jgi:hypothetical protein
MGTRLIATCLVLAGLPGCGGIYYAATVNAASARLEEAREVGAEQFAPYEYYYAKAHLDQAQVEASEGSYGDASDFAQAAEQSAEKAIQVAHEAHKAAGAE